MNEGAEPENGWGMLDGNRMGIDGIHRSLM
jgi:hypothetical protein